MNKLLLLFGLMKKAGRIEIGDEPVTDALRRGEAIAICCAADASENTMRHFERAAEGEEIPLLPLRFNKEELGGVFGRNTVAVIALTDVGFAAKLFELCAEEDMRWKITAEKFRRKSDELIAEQKRRRREEKEAKSKRYSKPIRPKQETTLLQSAHHEAKPQQRSDTRPYKFENNVFRGRSDDGRSMKDDVSSSGRTYGKIYGKAPKAKAVSLGERRREDAERQNGRVGEAQFRTGGHNRSSGRQFGEHTGGENRFQKKAGEYHNGNTYYKRKATQSAQRHVGSSVNRRNGGKA